MLNSQEVFLILSYKLIPVLVGAYLLLKGIYFFRKGVNSNVGDLSGGFSGYNFSLINTGPGTLLILAGCFLIGFSMFKGIDINIQDKGTPNTLLPIQQVQSQDSSLLKATSKVQNLDSLFNLADDHIKSEQYLLALKYLYFIQGAIECSKVSETFQSIVRKNILFSEKSLSTQILTKKESIKEETRSIHMNDIPIDSIK